MSKWNTEEEESQIPPTDYKTKSRLVLEGSGQYEWGVVKDCLGCINYIPEDAEVVGTWNKYSDGVFWISLTTSIEALADRATQLYHELTENRKKQLESLGPITKTKGSKRQASKSKPESAEIEVEPAPDPMYASLRARFGK